MNFLTFTGIVFIGVLLDRFILMNPNLWEQPKKEVKRGNFYVK